MLIKSHAPMTADIEIPVSPRKEIPKMTGGVLSKMTMAEAMMMAAMMIEKAIRLPILLCVS